MSYSSLLLQRAKLAYIEKNFTEVKNLLTRIINLEDFTNADKPRIAEGHYYLGILYLRGKGVEANISKYIFHLHKAYEFGDKVSGLILGNMYMGGEIVKKNTARGLGIYLDLAIKGNSIAMYKIGNYYLETEDEISAFNWFSYAAEAGYNPSFLQLAQCYKYGMGTVTNFREAEYWFQRSLPNLVAVFELGEMYEIHNFMDKAYILYMTYGKRDLEVIKQAVDLVINGLVLIDSKEKKRLEKIYKSLYYTENYDNFLMIEMNEPRKAFLIYESIAKEDIPIGMLSLGDCYRDGIGCKQNFYLSTKWYLKCRNYQIVRQFISNGKLDIRNKQTALLFENYLDEIKERGDIPYKTLNIIKQKIKEAHEENLKVENDNTDTETFIPEEFAVPEKIKEVKGLLSPMTSEEFLFIHSGY